MDRIKVERAIDGLAEWQKHVQTNSDIDRDISTAIEALKAQLSQQGTTKGTTSDLISKTETVEHLRRMLEATVPNTDYDEGYIDGVEFGISTASTMPTIQPVATDTNVGDTISRQAAIDAIVQCTNCGDEDTLREYVLKHNLDNGWTGGILEALDAVKDLPSAQPEPQWVPVSERLPEESEYYIITANDGVGHRTTFAKFQKKAKSWDLTGARSYWRVIAWMPIPEPYKPNNE